MWRWLDTLDDLDADFWTARVLSQPRPSPFLHPAFLRPWAQFFAGPLQLGCWDDRGLILTHQSSQGWELLGGQDVADRLDGLCPDAAFWAELREQRPQLSLPNLGPDAWALQSQASGDQLEQTDESPFIPLTGRVEDYRAALSGKQRHELARKMRRCERLCQGGMRLTQGDLDVFLQLHRLSSPRKALFMGDDMEAFFRALSASLQAHGMLQLDTLWDGDRPLASAFQIRFNNRLHLYNSGYDPEAAPLAPGLCLLGHCIERACLEGVEEFDLLRGTERYKYDLGGVNRPVYRLNWCN